MSNIHSCNERGGAQEVQRRALFCAGIALMGISFLIYPLYIVIPLLTLSLQTKAALIVAGSLISWGIMGVGGVLSGREGYPILKNYFRKTFAFERY